LADYYVHPQACCETDQIGEDSRVWAFAYILNGARIGREANICSHVFIEDEVVIGDRVTVKSGVQVWNGVRLEDDVFVGPNATFTNDLFPRSKHKPEAFPKTLIERGASMIVVGRPITRAPDPGVAAAEILADINRNSQTA
jgi:UDP-2-acetamido-3-amino-2,3-dideoxy-glucuronate N-acetyltransferase